MSMRGKTVLPGHTLWREGRPIRKPDQFGVGGIGRAKCECGAISPVLPSGGARRRWHRDHKSALRTSPPPPPIAALPSVETLTAERDRARLTAATLANRLWQAERLLMTVIQPGTSHAQDEETGRLINTFLANGGNHHD